MSEAREGVALRHWTIDKRVPLALILAISVQTCGIVWWASGLTSRVEQLERQAADVKPQADRLTRVEVRLDNVVDGISEIKALLRPSAATPAEVINALGEIVLVLKCRPQRATFVIDSSSFEVTHLGYVDPKISPAGGDGGISSRALPVSTCEVSNRPTN